MDTQTAARTLTFTRTIQAAPSVVYIAFTNSTLMHSWFSNTARVDARENGVWLAGWNMGFYAAGVFTQLKQDEHITYTWQGRGDPGETQVDIHLEQQGDATLLTVTHSGLGEGEAWDQRADLFAENWEAGLDNLVSVLETGLDQRVMRRPMLGIYPNGALDAATAQTLGVPVTQGIHLGGVVPGMGAEAAGLGQDDVIVTMDGKPTFDFQSFTAVIDTHQAGDTVPLEFYRGAEKHTTEMTLSGRSVPQVPATPEALAAHAHEEHTKLDAELDDLLQGITEAEADHRPAPSEWNIKENLAHLIWSQRWLQFWIFGLNGGDGNVAWPDNGPLHLLPALAVYPTAAALVAELKRAEAATEAVLAALPPELLARKALYTNVSMSVDGFVQHTQGHLAQMSQALESARS
ncbi:MAG: SRPBCC domain-containing protein [Anaerolineaceae bacterium]|nr:SRPBCC domain-containing protein [Anaerolineaceae bacterium]